MVYIPTKWSLGLKPTDFAIKMGAATGMGVGGSTHPTLFGDCFANLGFAGCLLGVFWALYATFFDKMIDSHDSYFVKILLFVLNAVAYCIMGRGSVYNGFWFVAFGVPLILISHKLIKNYENEKEFKKKINSNDDTLRL